MRRLDAGGYRDPTDNIEEAKERAALTARKEVVLPGATSSGPWRLPIEELRVWVKALEEVGRTGLRGLHADWACSGADHAVLAFRAERKAAERRLRRSSRQG